MRRSRRHFAIINRGCVSVFESNHHEATAAEIPGGRMRNCERKSHRDSGINRIAATFHDLNPGTRSDFVGRRHDATFCSNRFT